VWETNEKNEEAFDGVSKRDDRFCRKWRLRVPCERLGGCPRWVMWTGADGISFTQLTMGSTNAAVLPEPVLAIPTRSRPDSAAGNAMR